MFALCTALENACCKAHFAYTMHLSLRNHRDHASLVPSPVYNLWDPAQDQTTLVASPTGLCGLIPYSDSNSDSPDEMSSPELIPFTYVVALETSTIGDIPTFIPSRVILFGDIPTVIPSTSMVAPETSTIAHVISSVAPVVETTHVVSPTGLCGLVPYSGSDSDSLDEMSSPEHISPLPAISPFLCTDSSEALDSSDGPPSQDPYIATVAYWRSRVTSHPSSSSEFPIAPVTAPPRTR
ncbi:hypothetical protein Tco_1004194 [Tanacetum coccineum]|uniref:Uncharacterized protein n=1 Tax=Tanacetum coccineum TaxID=301880 RepID=A0ABQ5FB82_9ASTR